MFLAVHKFLSILWFHPSNDLSSEVTIFQLCTICLEIDNLTDFTL